MVIQALIYRAMFRGGWSPRQVDKMYIWEIAVALGQGFTEPERKAGTERTPGSAQRPPLGPGSRSRELLRQRMAHARGEAPAPEVRPPDMSQLVGLIG